jgi:hypothetical protein
MLTFLQLKTKVANFTQHKTDDSDMMTKIGDWLNLSQRSLAELYDFWTELETTYDFNTADGVETYDMPSDFDKAFRVVDLTNETELTPMTEQEYVASYLSNIANADEAAPTIYRIYGVSSRIRQMKLSLIPDDTYSMRIWYKKIPADMSVDGDYAFVDADRYLIFNSAGHVWQWERENEKAVISWQKAKQIFNELMMNQMRKHGTQYQHKFVSNFASAHRG